MAIMVSIVTGGSKGIGLAIARALLRRGDQVAISGRGEADLQKAAASLGGGERLLAQRADVREPADARKLVEETVRRFGGVDVLVNNAGVGRFTNVADMSVEAWREIIDTNLSGVFYCTHAALPEMRRRGGGFVINISSLAGKNAFTGGAAYCASKAGLAQLTRVLALELAPHHVRVNAIAPGATRTPFLGRAAAAEGVSEAELADKIVRGDLESFRTGIPLGRLAEPRDHAELVVFLASPAARHVTGQVVYVDGGEAPY